MNAITSHFFLFSVFACAPASHFQQMINNRTEDSSTRAPTSRFTFEVRTWRRPKIFFFVPFARFWHFTFLISRDIIYWFVAYPSNDTPHQTNPYLINVDKNVRRLPFDDSQWWPLNGLMVMVMETIELSDSIQRNFNALIYRCQWCGRNSCLTTIIYAVLTTISSENEIKMATTTSTIYYYYYCFLLFNAIELHVYFCFTFFSLSLSPHSVLVMYTYMYSASGLSKKYYISRWNNGIARRNASKHYYVRYMTMTTMAVIRYDTQIQIWCTIILCPRLSTAYGSTQSQWHTKQ